MTLRIRSLIAAFVLCLASNAWCTPKYKVLHAFTGGNDGGGLFGSLLVDHRGNVYGTTNFGGANGGGTVFELTPDAGGTWNLTNLYSFCSQPECSDGNASYAGVTSDKAGDLYGTTSDGGADQYGTIFGLTPEQDGAWTETVLHSFTQDDDGGAPHAGVAMDPLGDFFGTGAAWAFELSKGSDGWILDGLHAFTGQNGDGDGPAGLIRDSSGNLYGTTEYGGVGGGRGGGIAYELSPKPDGTWKENILHSFENEPSNPVGSLAMSQTGDLYGATAGYQGGSIFKLTREKGKTWKKSALHVFSAGAGGDSPFAGVVVSRSGVIYGTTGYGGDPNCYCGVVFKLASLPHGKWKYTVLHRFLGVDGAQPGASLSLDDKGNLYGTTELGGTYGVGVAFELTP